MFGRPIEARERRTLVLAAIVSVVALVAAYAVLPYARRWAAREQAIAGKREQLARLQWLVRNEARLTRTADERERALDAAPRRLLVGETASLAAAELQRVIQELANASQLDVQQIDVAGDAAAVVAERVGARVAATGDVIAVAEFLEQLTRGATFIDIEDVDLQPNPVLRGEALRLAVSLRAPYVQP
ncbi:MAG: type II secretion system protein GspM [Gemmatimonadaceae bacterium]